ncbi:MAG: cob(I)yrinic acid a,c-diamide adenosyltransferase [Dehalococcoidia bacterium]|nr:cob(I)yrinic acid a,c-diamide adenosyltransferase [Dehalococcoidia bacterium]
MSTEPGPQSVKGPRINKGLTIVNTGNGKGKTTAAMGVLFRAWGRDMKVQMLQFIKHTTANFGEQRAAQKIGVPVRAMGDGFTWRSKDLDQSADLARALWEDAKEIIASSDNDLVILDEFTYPLHYGWIEVQEVIETLGKRPEMLHIIITGRHAPQELIDFADLVTEMNVIKHPYSEGIKAQPGIEF